MKKLILGFSILMSSAGFAAAADRNVFNADLSHPDLVLAVSAFEETCMPFVLHKTEMTRETDKQHMAKLTQSRGYSFVSSELKPNYVVVEPHQEVWRPPSQAINPNGITIVRQTGENYLISDIIPPVYETKTYEDEIYAFQTDPRLSVNLRWNYLSQKDPGKQCDVTLQNTSLSEESWMENFVTRDEDWKAITRRPQQIKSNNWQQCIREEDADFLFKASYSEGNIKLSMTRSDFYHLELCYPRTKK